MKKIFRVTVDAGIFNGLNLNPPVMGFGDKSVLGASAEDALGTSVTFQLPDKPFFSDVELHSQMMVVSVSAPNIGKAMLTPPFIPRLNDYYGRHVYFIYNKARAERGKPWHHPERHQRSAHTQDPALYKSSDRDIRDVRHEGSAQPRWPGRRAAD